MKLISVLIAVAFASRGPPHPSSWNPKNTGYSSKQIFELHENCAASVFNQLPSHDPNLLRIASWNVHMLLSLDATRHDVDNFLQIIDQLDADVLMFQEVPLITNDGPYFEFLMGLKGRGYKHHVACFSSDQLTVADVHPLNKHGLMIASRMPLKRVKRFELGRLRVFMHVSVESNGESVHLMTSHLEVTSSEIRKEQVDMIADYLEPFKTSKFVYAGDFNCQADEPELTRLTPFTDIFTALDFHRPEYTCWAGSEIDFIFLGSGMEPEGAYMYHTAVSDHLPLIADFA